MNTSQYWFSTASAADLGDEITQSLKFRAGQVLARQFTNSPTSTTVGTLSFWFKIAANAENSEQTIFIRENNHWHAALGSDTLSCRPSGTGFLPFDNDRKYRDPNAWYHAVISTNSSNVRTCYVNGVLQLHRRTADAVFTSGTDTMKIGSESASAASSSFEGYLAEFIYVDGQELLPTSFGRYNNENVWVPRTYEGTFGNRGFHLDFADSANPGNDVSGNDMDFSDSGAAFDKTAISGSNFDNDVDIADTPTKNAAVLNHHADVPTIFDDAALESGNSGTGSWEQATPTVALTSGKWYWEARADNNASWGFGIADQRWDINANDNFIGSAAGEVGYNGANGNKHVDGTASAYGDSYTDGDVIGCALDLDNNAVWFSKNGTWQSSATQEEIEEGDTSNAAATGLTEERYFPVSVNSGSGSNWRWNFGQNNFQGTIPTGFSRINTENLPAPAFVDPSDAFQVIKAPGTAGILVYPQSNSTIGDSDTGPIDKTTEAAISVTSTFTSGVNRRTFVFDTIDNITNSAFTILSQSGGFWGSRTVDAFVSLTGEEDSWTQVINDQAFHVSNQNTVTIPAQSDPYRYIKLRADTTSNASWSTSSGTAILARAQAAFPTGMYWIKGEADSQVHFFIDPINGTDAAHRTPLPTATAAYTAHDGISYAWCWNCPDTFTANGITAGRRNVDAGFSIVQYEGDDSNPRSIPHGLGKQVGWVILWNPGASDTTCFITGLPGTGTNTENLIWNTNEAASNQFGAGTQHTPTDANNFIVGNSAGGSGVTGVNADGVTYTAFCWAPIDGYSAMGVYAGDGSEDGPFQYCGFKPAFVLIKSQGTDSWIVYDHKREVHNPTDQVFQVNLSDDSTNFTSGSNNIDILANGFKCRGTAGNMNGGNNYNWVAFAEHPFGGSGAAPATAR